MKRKCKCRHGGKKRHGGKRTFRKAFRGMIKPVRRPLRSVVNRAKGPLGRMVNAYHKRVPKLI